jgi:hypothetical protein
MCSGQCVEDERDVGRPARLQSFPERGAAPPDLAGATGGDSPVRERGGDTLVTVRHRLNRGGDRRANSALYTVVFTRLGRDPRTRAYANRRTTEGKSTKEIIRCLKRYVARELFPIIATSLAPAETSPATT